MIKLVSDKKETFLKQEKIWLPAFSPFPRMLSKVFSTVAIILNCQVKGLLIVLILWENKSNIPLSQGPVCWKQDVYIPPCC